MATVHSKIANLIREGQELQVVYKQLLNTRALQFKIIFDGSQREPGSDEGSAINIHTTNSIPEGMLLGIIDDAFVKGIDNGSRIKYLFKDKDIVTILLIQRTVEALQEVNKHLVDLGAPPFELPIKEKS